MISSKHVTHIFLLGLMFLTACATQPETSFTPATKTPVLVVTATSVPTPLSPRDSILWRALQVTMDELEITQEFLTDFRTTRLPPPGKKFLWVHIRLKNTGNIEIDIPLLENYSILYAATEVKPIYGYRSGYPEYTKLGAVIFPDKELDGWLRFDIPTTAELGDLRFVFLPESAQVGASFYSPNYPYSGDKPTFVWNCGP